MLAMEGNKLMFLVGKLNSGAENLIWNMGSNEKGIKNHGPGSPEGKVNGVVI